MTKDKISSQEIIDLVSSKASVSKRAAEEFLKVMIATIEEALMAGESVKIKGFGTFKLQWNEPRKSVNVQSGEEIVLDGYHKVTFAPDATLKELVNEPFAHLEPVELDAGGNFVLPKEDDTENLDPLRIFNEQASEIKDILSEIQSLNAPAAQDPASFTNEAIADYPLDEDEMEEFDSSDSGLQLDLSEAVMAFEAIQADSGKPQADIDEDNSALLVSIQPESSYFEIEATNEPLADADQSSQITDDTVEPVLISEPVAEHSVWVAPVQPEPETNDVVENATVPVTESADYESTPYLQGMKSKAKSKKKTWILLVVLAVVILGSTALAWIYFSGYSWSDSSVAKSPQNSKEVSAKTGVSEVLNTVSSWFKAKPEPVPVKKAETVVVPKDSIPVDTLPRKQYKKPIQAKVDSLQLMFDGPREYEEFIASEQITQGSRLTLMSEKYYGCRDFWVYIYEANKQKIMNPDKIQMGTLIRIPKIDARLIDASNPRCIRKAKELHDLYVKR